MKRTPHAALTTFTARIRTSAKQTLRTMQQARKRHDKHPSRATRKALTTARQTHNQQLRVTLGYDKHQH